MHKFPKAQVYAMISLSVLVAAFVLFRVTGRSGRQPTPGAAISGAGGSDPLNVANPVAAARELGRAKSKGAVVYLLAHLKDPDPELRSAIAWALGEIGDPRAVTDLSLRLDNEPEPAVKIAISQALVALGDPSVSKAFVDRLADPDPKVRLTAVNALATGSGEATIKGLIKALADEDAAVRDAATNHLGKIGLPIIEHIVSARHGAGADAVARYIIVLGRTRLPQTADAIADLVGADFGARGDPTGSPVYAASISALAELGDGGVDAIRRSAIEVAGRPGLKRIAAEAMVKIGTPRALAALRDRVLRWKSLPGEEEAAIWTAAIAKFTSAEAASALAQVQSHLEKLRKGEIDVGFTGGPGTRPAVTDLHARTLIKCADSGGFEGWVNIVLWKAIAPGGTHRPNLVLDAEAEGGQWTRLWGSSLGFNNGIHHGLVRTGKVEPTGAKFDIDIIVGDDRWVSGGPARYNITFKRNDAGELEGTYEGIYQNGQVSGRATGRILPPRKVRVANHRPVTLDEHPRMLFRASDLPALRKKLATPFGRAYQTKAYKSSRDVINLGMLYQLTGDELYATEAMKVVQTEKDLLEEIDRGTDGSGSFGHNVVATSLAYDLCYHAWPASFREQVRERMRRAIPTLQKYIAISHANHHPCSNYYGPGRAAPAVAAMAMWGEPGPAPTRPVDPIDQAKSIETTYAAGKGVPIADLTAGKIPPRWLIAGPVSFKLNPDAYVELLKEGRLLPEEGTSLQCMAMVAGEPKEAKLEFKSIAASAVSDAGIDLAGLLQDKGTSTTLLFCAIKVDKEQVIGLVRGSPDTKVYLSGTEIDDTGYYRLKAGIHPILVAHATDNSTKSINVRLCATDGPELSSRRLRYEIELAQYQQAQAVWEKTGCDPDFMRWAETGFLQVYRHYRLGIGDGGFQAETGSYGLIASYLPLVYGSLYFNTFGRDPSPHPDITHLMPRRMMQVLFKPDGRTTTHKLNSVAGWDSYWASLSLPMAPDAYRPALLWGWRKASVADADPEASELLVSEGLRLAVAFVRFPLADEGVEPAKAMPLTWSAPTFGHYTFRSGWQGKDEFIGQAFAKASLIGGWSHPNAGTFRIFGLGVPWVAGSYVRVGFRIQEPVVLLPDDQIAEGACGRVTHLQTQKDGSATITIDLADVYSKSERLYGKDLLRYEDRFIPSGISGLRAMAFDYSGKCGAPAMLVLVDKIDGGKSRRWLWPVPDGTLGAVKVAGRSFTLTQGDASMKLTFITPDDPRIEAVSEQVKVGIIGDGHRSFEGTLQRVKASSADHFFCIATFQRGSAPEVKIEGRGLDAKVSVGGQVVRFDGTRVVLGQ